MKLLRGTLMVALSLVLGAAAFAQTTTPNVGLNLVPGDVSFSRNMSQLDGLLSGAPGTVGLRSAVLTSPTTIVSTTFVTTGLAFPAVPASGVVHGHCTVVWEQATAANTVQFGVGNSSAPTGLYVTNTLSNGAGGVTKTDQYTTVTTTTTTAISAAAAPTAASTGYKDEIDFVLNNAATGADVVTVYGLTGSASDAFVIEPGSWCAILP